MIRRYSRPRHFTAGWTSPFEPLAMNWQRLDHHAFAALVRSTPATSERLPPRFLDRARSTTLYGVASKRPDPGGRLAASVSMCQSGPDRRGPCLRWPADGTGRASSRRGTAPASSTADRPPRTGRWPCRGARSVEDAVDIRRVGGDSCRILTVHPFGGLPQCRRCLGQRGPALRPPRRHTAIRSNSWALADHGINSQSRHAQVRVELPARSRWRPSPPESGRGTRLPSAVVEEAPARAGVDDPRFADDRQIVLGCLLVPADDDHGTGAHVLLLAHDLRDALRSVIGERLASGTRGIRPRPARFAGRHGGRQVDQPLRIGGKAAHDFQSRHGVLFPDRDIGRAAGSR